MDIRSRLPPEFQEAFDHLPRIDLGDIDEARLTERRRFAAPTAPPSPTVVSRDYQIPGASGDPQVRLRRYAPRQPLALSPCVVWLQGGGFVKGELHTDDAFLGQIVDAVGCTVFSVDWRRAPERPFPAACNDSFAAVSWMVEHAAELEIDTDRLAVGGASSGGGLAASLALRLRDTTDIRPCLQLLIHPMLDDRNASLSSMTFTEPKLWHREANLSAWRSYLGASFGTEDVSPYAAPARAADLTGLPPAYLPVGELDLFLDEDIEYAQRLLQSEVPCELHVYPGAVHGFYSLVPQSSLAIRFREDLFAALRRAFRT